MPAAVGSLLRIPSWRVLTMPSPPLQPAEVIDELKWQARARNIRYTGRVEPARCPGQGAGADGSVFSE